MTLTRISLTIAPSLVSALDRKARELDRSRSWLIAEAVRRFLEATAPPSIPAKRPAAVREPGPPPYAAAEVAAARRRHLQNDVALPPAERLRRAEELGRLARQAQHWRKGARHQVIGFDTYQDYYQWKKGRLVGA